MKGIMRKPRKCLQKNEAFISAYFLAILLYVVSIISVVILKDEMSMRTMQNMKQADAYLRIETEVLYDIKQRLLTDTLSEEGFLQNGKYFLEQVGNTLYVSIEAEKEETLVITIDSSEKIVLDYVSQREVKK